ITGRDGASALDTGRGFTGNGYRYLERSLAQILSGNTTHGGALLGPLGIEFVVAETGPPGAGRAPAGRPGRHGPGPDERPRDLPERADLSPGRRDRPGRLREG